MMGRSVADFHLPGYTAQALLGFANGFASERRMRIEDASPNHLTIRKGSAWWTSKRVLRIVAWDVSGGASVHIEAWAEAIPWGEFSADPNAFIGWLPRRSAWKIASAFVARLGIVPPESVFRHL